MMDARMNQLRGRTSPRLARGAGRGAILIIAMIILFALAAMVLVLGRSVRVEATASANFVASERADAIARGAEQYVLALLTEEIDALDELEEADFEALALGEGYFWIVRPDYDDADLPLFGLVEESSKLDLNSAPVEMLEELAGMTEEIAAAIVDWRDEDEEVSDHGAESQVYLGRSEPYRAKNAPFETVEEALLVNGMTRELLYGDGSGAPLGMEGMSRSGPFMNERYRVRGLFDHLTVWSASSNMNPEGEARLNVNDPERRQEVRDLLSDRLSETRQNAQWSLPQQVEDIFDFARRLGLTAAELALVEPYLTTSNEPVIHGRVNINVAPREVLLCLPELDDADVDALLAARPAAMAANPGSVAWVLETLADKAVGLGGRITGRGTQYSADIVAVSDDGRSFKRVRIVVDTSGSTPMIVYRRDRSDLGWPLDPAILEGLRAGQRITGAIAF